MKKAHGQIFTVIVLTLLAVFMVLMILQFIPPKPDAEVEGIRIYLSPTNSEGCELDPWVDSLPEKIFAFDKMGADLELWEEGFAKETLKGTFIVLHKEPWYVHPIGKVAGIASYRYAIEVLCDPKLTSLLYREWYLMLMCDLGGLDNYEEECLTPTARTLIGY